MGFGHKFRKQSHTIGRKSRKISHTLARKAPAVLDEISKDMKVAAKVGEAAATAATLLGAPEIGAPILAASETLRLGSTAAGGASKTIAKGNKGDYVGAIGTAQQTVLTVKKDRQKSLEKQQKKENKIST